MPRSRKSTKKLGRTETIKSGDLLDRYVAQKRFLEHNWGRLFLRIRAARKPSDVSVAFKTVPSVEWCPPFRDYKAKCLLDEAKSPVSLSEVRLTQCLCQDAREAESRLWTSFHSASDLANSAKKNLDLLIAEFGAYAFHFRFFYILFVGAKEFKVREFADAFVAAQHALDEGRKCRADLEAQKISQEAWFAQTEILKFRRSKRQELTPLKLAKATAGLPEYGWLNSFRRCTKLDNKVPASTAYPYQLLVILKKLIKRMKPLRLSRVEERLRRELLSKNTDPLLREWLKPRWGHVKRAFADHRGKKFTRFQLPYLLIGAFLDHMERPKSQLEVELARAAEIDLST